MKSGGVSFSFAQFSGAEDPPVGGGGGDYPSSPVHFGEVQCNSGRLVETRADSRVRVDSLPGGVRRFVQNVAGDDRFICYASKSSLLCIFCTNLGPHGCGNGCHAPVMGQPPGLRLSSSSYDEAGVKQGSGIVESVSNLDCSPVATKRVVPRFVGAIAASSSGATSKEGSLETASRSQIPSKTFHASSSCLETLQRSARSRGLSSKVAGYVGGARRASSIKNYQAKWNVFRVWCKKHGRSSSVPSIPKLAEFLVWLWEKKRVCLFYQRL